MRLKEWEELPLFMRTEAVRPYYDRLKKKKGELLLKRLFDMGASAMLCAALLPVLAALSVLVAADSRGGVLYRQERVTQYGRRFRIFKFRTMTAGADRTGPQVTVGEDRRITRSGRFLRKYRLDELPQLFNILKGDMTFVGTRPEVPRYVKEYTPEMAATLLLPAGVTSVASVRYKDEAELLAGSGDPDRTYVERVLPGKMRYNLKSLETFGLWEDVKVMALTVREVFGRED